MDFLLWFDHLAENHPGPRHIKLPISGNFVINSNYHGNITQIFHLYPW